MMPNSNSCGIDVKSLIVTKMIAKITKDKKIEDLPVDQLLLLNALQEGNLDLKTILNSKVVAEMIDGNDKDIDLEKLAILSSLDNKNGGSSLSDILALKLLKGKNEGSILNL